MTEAAAAPSYRHPVTPDRERLDAAAEALRMLADPTRLHLLQ